MKIAFLGLGAMGARMAGRLAAAGHDLAVWNRTPPAGGFPGARLAPTPRAAAEGAEIIVSMLTDDPASHAVWLGREDGAVAGAAPGALGIEAGTVTPGWVRELGAALAARGAALIDAPVAGSRPQAEAGQLVFLAGGAAADLARARPALGAMGRAVLHAGPLGMGAVLKLAVNAFFAAQLASMAELLALLGREGIAAPEAAEMLASLPVTSPALAGAARMMAAGDRAPLFTVDLVAKDLGYAIALGGALPVTEAARASFARAQAAGLGGANVTGLAEVMRAAG